MQTRPVIDRRIQCNSAELLESRASNWVNNNTTNTANMAQNAPQSVTRNLYEAPSFEKLGDDE